MKRAAKILVGEHCVVLRSARNGADWNFIISLGVEVVRYVDNACYPSKKAAIEAAKDWISQQLETGARI